MPSWIDGTLYPDTDVPDVVESFEDRIDFLSRLCGAWDFGVLPEREGLRSAAQGRPFDRILRRNDLPNSGCRFPRSRAGRLDRQPPRFDDPARDRQEPKGRK